jgi:1-acyl-sn-glycerol-3-phosphate acyltransferase
MNKTILFLRSLLFFLGLIFYTIIHASLSFLTYFLPLKYRYYFITAWTRIILWWLKITCNLNYQVTGRENILNTPAIILCKHQSMWETLALQLIFPMQTWVLKQSLLNIPFFGWALRLLKPIAIDRAQKKAAMKQLIEQGRQCLQEGRWIVIFPEGTRVAPKHTKSFSKGGASLAIAANSPIIPVAHNAGTYWQRRSFIKYPGVITLIVGNAIYPDNQTVEQITQQAELWINQTTSNLEK